jgi:hypothetical protein
MHLRSRSLRRARLAGDMFLSYPQSAGKNRQRNNGYEHSNRYLFHKKPHIIELHSLTPIAGTSLVLARSRILMLR